MAPHAPPAGGPDDRRMLTNASSPAHRRRRARAALTVAGVLCLAGPAVAQADSILYLDGGDVWSAHPDGSGRVRLTDGGDWHSPTQADDGTFAAVQTASSLITLFAPDGRPLRTIETAAAKSSDGGTFAPRPVQLSLSPDGSKLAYAYVASSCPVASTCGTIQRSTFYTDTNVGQATPVSVYGNQYGVSNPEWVTNTRTLVFGGSGRQVSIDDLGPGDYSQIAWITPNADMGDGEVSRDGRRLATTFGYGDATIVGLFAVNGDVKTQSPPPQPSIACEFDRPDARYGDPSWSPDGSGLAYEASDGIQILRFTAFGPGTCETAGTSTTFAATGSAPDWGPADPPAARWTPPPVEQTGGQQNGPGGPGGSGRRTGSGGGRAGGRRPRVAFRLTTPKTTTATALRRGLALTAVAPAGSTLRATLRRGRATVARATARARRAGRLTIRLPRLSQRAARKLRGRRLTLTVVATATGRSSATVARALTVKRR